MANPITPFNWFFRLLKSMVYALIDTFPPYHKIEGLLESKETDERGRHIICVGSSRVEVDKATFETLVMGENLRVRFTRAGKAINIDRLLPGRGPG